MFPPELYAAVKRIEASAAPLLRSSAERIVILDTHVVLECTLWRDESESDSPLGCALKAGRIVPAASHETLLELAGSPLVRSNKCSKQKRPRAHSPCSNAGENSYACPQKTCSQRLLRRLTLKMCAAETPRIRSFSSSRKPQPISAASAARRSSLGQTAAKSSQEAQGCRARRRDAPSSRRLHRIRLYLSKDIPDHAYDSIDDPESTGGKAEPNKNSNDAGSHEISQDLWKTASYTSNSRLGEHSQIAYFSLF